MTTVYIETPRLRLRQWRQEDLATFTRMNSDPEVMRYFPAPMDEEATKQFYDRIQEEFQQYGYGLYAAEEKAGGSFMGFIGFHWARFEADFCPCVEIGWRLWKDFWNRGYATEGAMACLAHGFSHLGFQEVCSFTATTNLPSQRVMQKAGMERERFFDHPALPEEHILRPHVRYVVKKQVHG